jgi:hypothetical protein
VHQNAGRFVEHASDDFFHLDATFPRVPCFSSVFRQENLKKGGSKSVCDASESMSTQERTELEERSLPWIAGDERLLLDERPAPDELDGKVLERLRGLLSGVLPRAKELRLAEPGEIKCGLLLGVLPTGSEDLISNLRAWVLFVAEPESHEGALSVEGELALGMETEGLRALACAAAFLRDFPTAQITDCRGYPLLCFETDRAAAKPVCLEELRSLEGKVAQLQFTWAS